MSPEREIVCVEYPCGCVEDREKSRWIRICQEHEEDVRQQESQQDHDYYQEVMG